MKLYLIDVTLFINNKSTQIKCFTISKTILLPSIPQY